MAALLYANNATSRLKIDIPAGSLTIQLPTGEGARFPAPANGDYFKLTLDDRRTGQMEICHCTANVADILTVERAQEGTLAQDFIVGAVCSNRVTAGTLAYFQYLIDNAGGYDRVTADARFVNVDGDAMTGPLAGIAPSAPADLTRKDYVDTQIATRAPTVHTHTIAQVTNLQAELDNRPTLPLDANPYVRTNTAWVLSITKATYDTDQDAQSDLIDTNTAAIAALTTTVNGKLSEAPNDGKLYGRKSANWLVPGIGDITNLQTTLDTKISDAASDGKQYVRQNAAWMVNAPGEAPTDGSQYARQSGQWSKVTGGAVISDTAPAGALPSSFWWESDSGALYINYQDANTTQWVMVNAAGMPEAPKDAKSYARRDGAWFDLTASFAAKADVSYVNTQLASYLPLAGGSPTGLISSSERIQATINMGAGNYAFTGTNNGAGGGVIGQSSGIYGILGYQGYSLYGNGPVYTASYMTSGSYITCAAYISLAGAINFTNVANTSIMWNGDTIFTTSNPYWQFAFGGTVHYRMEGTIFRTLQDNNKSLGAGSYRWTTVYAVTGTINTSDEREKEDIRPLLEKEIACAKALKPLICMYRWKDRVAEKGQDARIHCGIIAQRVQEVFEAEGLDVTQYGFWCADPVIVWHHPVYEEDPETKEVTTISEGYEEDTGVVRYGVRYDELAMFILAGL